jgi:DNA polymerase III delta prime subunit
MTPAAQVSLLSKLDATNFPPNTIFIFTCNATDRLEPRFLSRCHVIDFSSYGISAEASQLLEKNLESGNRKRFRPSKLRPYRERFRE